MVLFLLPKWSRSSMDTCLPVGREWQIRLMKGFKVWSRSSMDTCLPVGREWQIRLMKGFKVWSRSSMDRMADSGSVG
jgi:hypothetical protein